MNCAICSKELFTENPLTYFCKSCYSTYKDDIINKAEWVRYCVACEGRQRYRIKDMQKLGITYLYLGDEWDISAEGKLVPLKEHWEDNN